MIWIFWDEDCECWMHDWMLSYNAHLVTIKNMTPIVLDNSDVTDIHISWSIDDRISRAEDYLDAVIQDRK